MSTQSGYAPFAIFMHFAWSPVVEVGVVFVRRDPQAERGAAADRGLAGGQRVRSRGPAQEQDEGERVAHGVMIVTVGGGEQGRSSARGERRRGLDPMPVRLGRGRPHKRSRRGGRLRNRPRRARSGERPRLRKGLRTGGVPWSRARLRIGNRPVSLVAVRRYPCAVQ